LKIRGRNVYRWKSPAAQSRATKERRFEPSE
jgi:hypothetical protein